MTHLCVKPQNCLNATMLFWLCVAGYFCQCVWTLHHKITWPESLSISPHHQSSPAVWFHTLNCHWCQRQTWPHSPLHLTTSWLIEATCQTFEKKKNKVWCWTFCFALCPEISHLISYDKNWLQLVPHLKNLSRAEKPNDSGTDADVSIKCTK